MAMSLIAPDSHRSSSLFEMIENIQWSTAIPLFNYSIIIVHSIVHHSVVGGNTLDMESQSTIHAYTNVARELNHASANMVHWDAVSLGAVASPRI